MTTQTFTAANGFICAGTTKQPFIARPASNLFHFASYRSAIRKTGVLLLTVFFLAFSAGAQETQKNALKFNPLSLLLMTGNLSYERALSNNLSIQTGGFYSGAGTDELSYQGYGVVPEFRFYLGRQAAPLNGVYIAPFGRYQNFAITNKELKNKARFTAVGGGAVAGYQKRWESGFILNVFAGPSINHLQFNNNNQEDDFDLQAGFRGFGLRTGLTLGFSF